LLAIEFDEKNGSDRQFSSMTLVTIHEESRFAHRVCFNHRRKRAPIVAHTDTLAIKHTLSNMLLIVAGVWA
jgi:hypothetical protein